MPFLYVIMLASKFLEFPAWSSLRLGELMLWRIDIRSKVHHPTVKTETKESIVKNRNFLNYCISLVNIFIYIIISFEILGLVVFPKWKHKNLFVKNIYFLTVIIYLRPFVSSLPFHKFWTQNFMYFRHKYVKPKINQIC